ncbi:hypothetical protein [uncultured Salipiger sp.]|uniref:hypothetical protein n=1 Tax=uncultured Salipiger sp. TaxID=499810 RepID=UPI0025953204|nr:hypothetical protein [uncultured Salipiger sp.]
MTEATDPQVFGPIRVLGINEKGAAFRDALGFERQTADINLAFVLMLFAGNAAYLEETFPRTDEQQGFELINVARALWDAAAAVGVYRVVRGPMRTEVAGS